MPLLSLLREELWRKIITEYYQAEANLIKLVPIEKYQSEEVVYYVQKEIATAPEKISPGAGFPVSMGTYEKGTVTLEMYGIGVEIHRHDIDWRRFNVLERELEQKARGMALYQDRKIGTALDGVTENVIDLDPVTAKNSWKDGFSYVVDSVALAISYLEEDNIPLRGRGALIVSPTAHYYMLSGMTVTAETITAPGVIREGRVQNFLGLDVVVSNNLPTPTNAFVVARNLFGWMAQAYPISTLPPELVRELMVYRAFIYAMDGFVLDQPKAVCKIADVYA